MRTATAFSEAHCVKLDAPAGSSNGRVRELDGLRGVAVLSIVLLHYVIGTLQVTPGSLPAYAQKYMSFLWVGVDIFFVLSGYLIGGILLDNRLARNCLQVFYLRRGLRLLPAYLLLLSLFALALAGWRAAPKEEMRWLMSEPLPLWTYLFYVQNFFMAAGGQFGSKFMAATWSLAVEEQFYLCFPLLVRWCPSRLLARVLIGLILAAPILRFILCLSPSDSYMSRYVLMPSRWDSLLLGVLAAWVTRQPAVFAFLTARRRAVRAVFVFACAVTALFPFAGGQKEHITFFSAVICNLWIAVTVALLLILLRIGCLEALQSILRLRLLRFFGRISYSVYLFHTAFLGLVFAIVLHKEPQILVWTDWVAVAAAFALTVVFAQATWKLFEERSIRLGHKISYQRPMALHAGETARVVNL